MQGPVTDAKKIAFIALAAASVGCAGVQPPVEPGGFRVATQPPPGTQTLEILERCAPWNLGVTEVLWGSFGRQPNGRLLFDSGESLELRCVGIFTPSYELVFREEPTSQGRVVGSCPFVGGCNYAKFTDSGDSNDNGRPDSLRSTEWVSWDGGFADDDWFWSHATGRLLHMNDRFIDEVAIFFDRDTQCEAVIMSRYKRTRPHPLWDCPEDAIGRRTEMKQELRCP